MLLYFAITPFTLEGQQWGKAIHSTGTISLIPVQQLQLALADCHANASK